MRLRRLLFLILIAVLVSFGAAIVYRLTVGLAPHTAEKMMSLEDALWVCTADTKMFYGPGTPPSVSLVRILAERGMDPKTKRFAHYLCYRIPSTNDVGNFILLWEPFDPNNIPPFVTGGPEERKQ
jgi:hypothetical protein